MSSQDSHQNAKFPGAALPPLEVGRLTSLINEIERDIDALPQNSPAIDNLRADLLALKSLVEQEPNLRPESDDRNKLKERLGRLATTMEGEVLKDSRYVAEAGRILGLI